jgi:hypothetical protein
MDTSFTITVGATGDYPTISAALTVLSSMSPVYRLAGVTATIELQAGFTLTEQITITGIDLSWIQITGVDAATNVTTSTITNSAFEIEDGGRSPLIGQLFVSDQVVNKKGLSCIGAGSVANIAPDCGFKYFQTGIVCQYGAIVNARFANLSYCYYGVYATCGMVNVQYADASFCVRGIYSTYNSIVHADHGSFPNCDIGIHSFTCSIVTATDVDCSNANDYGIVATFGAQVLADGANCSAAGNTGLYVGLGSYASGYNINCLGATSYGVRAGDGSIIDCPSVDARKGTSDSSTDIYTQTGSIIKCYGATGGVNVTIRTLTSSGLILK